MDLVNILYGENDFCNDATPILRIVGIVVFAIKIVVPIILIIVGMIDLAKAVAAKDEKDIKAAQQGLVKKAVSAVLVFLVVSIVGLLMGIVGEGKYKDCLPCVNNVFSKSCKDQIKQYNSENKNTPIPQD